MSFWGLDMSVDVVVAINDRHGSCAGMEKLCVCCCFVRVFVASYGNDVSVYSTWRLPEREGLTSWLVYLNHALPNQLVLLAVISLGIRFLYNTTI